VNAVKRLDFALDRAAIALTGKPETYVRAIQLAVTCVPFPQSFPWWFKPRPLSARVAAIVKTFNLDPGVTRI
jgi:hypothetical protein